MTIELKTGKTYLDRHGNTWRITRFDPGYRYPYVGYKTTDPFKTEESFTAHGRWSHHTTMGCDLVNPAEN